MRAHEDLQFQSGLEPDADFDGNPAGWHAFCPVLERQGASTWRATEAEALKNIESVYPPGN
jgi:hypothetical protein